MFDRPVLVGLQRAVVRRVSSRWPGISVVPFPQESASLARRAKTIAGAAEHQQLVDLRCALGAVYRECDSGTPIGRPVEPQARTRIEVGFAGSAASATKSLSHPESGVSRVSGRPVAKLRSGVLLPSARRHTPGEVASLQPPRRHAFDGSRSHLRSHEVDRPKTKCRTIVRPIVRQCHPRDLIAVFDVLVRVSTP